MEIAILEQKLQYQDEQFKSIKRKKKIDDNMERKLQLEFDILEQKATYLAEGFELIGRNKINSEDFLREYFEKYPPDSWNRADELIKKLEKWKEEGYDVSELEEMLK